MCFQKDRVVTVTRLGNDDIADLLHKASIAFHALPEDQQQKLMEEQRNSWVLGEAAIQRRERLQAIVDAHPLQTHANMQEPVEYALTKLQGLLVRMEHLTKGDAPVTGYHIFRETLSAAMVWAETLRHALERKHG